MKNLETSGKTGRVGRYVDGNELKFEKIGQFLMLRMPKSLRNLFWLAL